MRISNGRSKIFDIDLTRHERVKGLIVSDLEWEFGWCNLTFTSCRLTFFLVPIRLIFLIFFDIWRPNQTIQVQLIPQTLKINSYVLNKYVNWNYTDLVKMKQSSTNCHRSNVKVSRRLLRTIYLFSRFDTVSINSTIIDDLCWPKKRSTNLLIKNVREP